METTKLKKVMETILMIILIMSFTLATLPSQVRAYDVIITSISPTSHRGKVGDIVRVVGLINKTDGLYQIWFGDRKINETHALGNKVDVKFAVPALPGGNYTIKLVDVEANINATTWFYIDTAYYISVSNIPKPPGQLQEGSQIEIMVNVTGGKQNTIYVANITVKTPHPANETYWTLIKLTNTTSTGEGHSAPTIYPDDFHGKPHTNYTGTYSVTFNQTLATCEFMIGLTNSTEYHRYQHVNIRASGYKPNEKVTVKILHGDKTLHIEDNVTATDEGFVHSNWVVPGNASIGTYTVSITSSLTRKTSPDVQNFIVPGFKVTISAKNLAREPVPKVKIQVLEAGKSIANETTGSDGTTVVPLETGVYLCRAFYKGEKVGERFLNITGVMSVNVSCTLSNLKILVLNKDGVCIPEVQIYLKQENQTISTDIDGTAVFHSLLPNANYTLNLSRYNMQFNTTIIPDLLVNGDAVASFNVTVICPTYTLRVNVVKANRYPITNALVKIQELIGGLFQERETDATGMAIFNCTFGRYHIEVYNSNGIKLNETNVDLFGHNNTTIYCKLYGLTVSVRVIDYFGQPIQNVNVVLQREGTAPISKNTQNDGTAIFDGINGGNLHISTYLTDQTTPCKSETFFIDSSTTIHIKLDKYVVLAGFLIETSQLTTLCIIIGSIALFLFIEFYRRKRLKT
jgi:hypothetical protein